MNDPTFLLVAGSLLVLVVIFSCLTLVALTALGKGRNETAERAITGIRQVAQDALNVVPTRQRKM